MLRRESVNKTIWILMTAGLIGFAVLATVRTLFIGLDCDEQYAVALAYRLAHGDSMLKEMWEPHQTSVLLPALLIKIYAICVPDLSYLLLYLRMVGVLMQLWISVFWYAVVRQKFGTKPAFLSAMVLFLTVPKWMTTPEFANQQIWFLVLTILFFLRYEDKGKKIDCVLGGIAFALEVLAYPSCVVLFIPYFIWLFRKNRRAAVLFFVTCFSCAAVFLGYLLSYLSPGDMIKYIRYVVDDPEHSAGMVEKLSAYGTEGFGILKYILVYLAIGAVIAAVSTIAVRQLFSRKIPFLRGLCFLTILTAMADQTRLWILEKAPTVHPQIHYLLLFFLGGILYYCASEGMREKWNSLFGLAWLPSILAFMAVLLLTNLDMRGSFAHLLPGMLCAVLFWCDSMEEEEKVQLKYILPVLWVVLLSCARIFLLRFDGGLPTNVFCVKQKALYGTAKNVYCTYMVGYGYNSNYLFLTEKLRADDKILYIGYDPLIYLMTDTDICSASVISTPVFNERYLEYFECNPEKYPSAIVINKVYWEREELTEMATWILQNYNWDEREESEFLWLVRE